jgi:hypothetical protein
VLAQVRADVNMIVLSDRDRRTAARRFGAVATAAVNQALRETGFRTGTGC